MAAAMSSAVTLVPDVAVIDDLELLRNGVLGAACVGPDELVAVPLGGVELPAGAEAVQVTDAEGVPLALIPLVGQPHSPTVAQGAPTWLARRSARPFEQLHLNPDQLGLAETLIVTDRAFDPGELEARSGGGAVHVIVLASTDNAGRGEVSVINAARTFAAANSRTTVSVVPLHPQAAEWVEKKQRIVAAYARGARVVDVTREPRSEVAGAATGGAVVFFTGLSGSGKSTVARAVRNWLVERGRPVTFLDGDLVRRHLSAGLGFGAADRDRNIRRIGWVAAEVAGHGGIAICSPIAPYEQTRVEVREMVRRRGGRFVLVHVATPLHECERRDRKGLYARARRGEIPDFTGISAPYEVPEKPELRVDTTDTDLEEVRDAVLALLRPDGEEGRQP